MTVTWLLGNKIGHALMGVAFRETQKGYWVKVTSYENKSDRKEVGQIFFVTLAQAQVKK